ncbi:MAG: YggS family pyridoxal phosphate-dependent enzyme [Thiotrichales bacterium]|nr:YggS family pyridoxal phosphate-dependent enzyme [Thiotrichales bacterium]
MKNIPNRLIQLLDTIRTLEQRYQRPAGSVQLLAVSKTWPLSDIQQARSAGQRMFGENYVQEAVDKITQSGGQDIEWHFIGPVQSNKTRAIAEHFHWCHSVDRFKSARRLSDARPENRSPLNVCVQVNISRESAKSGIDARDVFDLCEQVQTLPGIRLRGLMAMPKPVSTLDQQRIPFRKLQQLQENLKQRGYAMDTLSIGTSHDLEAAIAEGATIVRIGTAIFGSRNR